VWFACINFRFLQAMSEMGIVLTEFDKTGDRILGGYLIVKPVSIWVQKYGLG
jgi:hypothetical protein